MVKKREPSGSPPSAGVREGLLVDKIGKSFRGRPVVKSVSLRLGRGEVAACAPEEPKA